MNDDGGQPAFVDYVSGGCRLHVCVAIDFTGSNGKSSTETSSWQAFLIIFTNTNILQAI